MVRDSTTVVPAGWRLTMLIRYAGDDGVVEGERVGML